MTYSAHSPRPWPEDAPSVKSSAITLFAFINRELKWASNIGEKRDLVSASGGKLYAAWSGNWATHIFQVERRQAKKDLGQ